MTGGAKDRFNQTSGFAYGTRGNGQGQKDSLDNFGNGQNGNANAGGTQGNTGRSCSVGGKGGQMTAE